MPGSPSAAGCKSKYDNDLDELNQAWWAAFWSHTYTDWEQIESPSPIGEMSLHGLNLDWKRFITDQTIDFYNCEIEPLRELTPDVPITTNFMGLYHRAELPALCQGGGCGLLGQLPGLAHHRLRLASWRRRLPSSTTRTAR